MEKSFFINQPNPNLPNNKTIEILNKSDALSFHTKLHNYKPTPLVCLKKLAQKYKVGNIYIKDESFRLGLNAFKGLGASFAISQIIKQNTQVKTFCTATDGNHGRAVAWASTYFDRKAVVFVPKGTTKQRIQAIKDEGATVEVVDGNYDVTCKYAEEVSKKNGWVLVQDMAWQGYEEIPALIVAGYLSMFKEIQMSLKSKIDVVFLQAGVGSFAGAGIYHYLKEYGENCPKIVIVEPNAADALLESFKQNRVSTSLGNSETIMAGLNCGTPSLGVWELIKNGVDVAIKIDDDYAKKAMRELYRPIGSDSKVISGESGVGGFAGFIAMHEEKELRPLLKELNINQNSNLLFISTEGATDKEMFEKITI